MALLFLLTIILVLLLDSIGQTIIISDSSYNVNKGLVKVFTYKQDNQWEQIGQDLIGDNDNDLLGEKIDMNKDGNIIAVSKKGDSLLQGGVNVYRYLYKTNEWELLQNTIRSGTSMIKLGASLKLSDDGTHVITSAISETDTYKGKVYVYKYKENQWNAVGSPIEGENVNDYFGCSIDCNKDVNILSIGAYHHDSNENTNSGMVKTYFGTLQ